METEVVCYPIFDDNKIVEWCAILENKIIGFPTFKALRIEILKKIPNAILKQSSVSISFGEKIDIMMRLPTS